MGSCMPLGLGNKYRTIGGLSPNGNAIAIYMNKYMERKCKDELNTQFWEKWESENKNMVINMFPAAENVINYIEIKCKKPNPAFYVPPVAKINLEQMCQEVINANPQEIEEVVKQNVLQTMQMPKEITYILNSNVKKHIQEFKNRFENNEFNRCEM